MLLSVRQTVAQTNTFPASGNVGIGTTSPGANLEILNSSVVQTTPLVLRNEYGGPFDLKTVGLAFRGGNGYWAAIYGGQQFTNSWSCGSLSFGTRTSDAAGVQTKMTILANGNVGIGTTGPTGMLDVQGSSATNAYTAPADQADLRVLSSNNRPLDGGIIEVGGSWGATGYIKSEALNVNAGAMTFGTRLNPNDTTMQPAMTLNGGNVGIGTTTPSYPLQITTGVNIPLWLSGSNTQCTLMEFQNTASGVTWGIGAGGNNGWSNNNFIIDQYGVGNRFVISNSGNVGIGTTNPTYPLSVNGTVRAKEVIVDTGWSDFVFASNHRLAPLSEVEATIRTDHHLPGIPSQADVSAKGVSVGDMQARLLEKVEELTLYVIAQDKRIEKLEQENRQLRADR